MSTIQVNTSIGEALLRANPGDVIEVPQGDWKEEPIIIRVPGVTLQPTAGGTPIIHTPRITIAAADVTVRGMTIITSDTRLSAGK